MRIASLLLLVLITTTWAGADEPAYRLRIDSSVEASRLTVVPVITAPAGSRLRYEMISTKQGHSGKSNTSQGGAIVVGADGSAALSTLRLGVSADDRYQITVKVFDGSKLVAEDALRYPQQ